MHFDDNIRMVFSTESGRIKEEKQVETAPEGDGIVRIREAVAVAVERVN